MRSATSVEPAFLTTIRDHAAGVLLWALAALQGYPRREVAMCVSFLLMGHATHMRLLVQLDLIIT